MNSNNGWLVPILSATVLLLATVAVGPLQKFAAFENAPKQEASGSTVEEKNLGSVELSVVDVSGDTSSKTRNLEIRISSLTEKVTGVELLLVFDPNTISVSNISGGSFLNSATVLQKEIDNKKGLVLFTIGTLTPKNGSGTLVELSAIVKSGRAEISISSDSKVTALGADKSVLGRVSGVKIQ
ncbi:MAG: cohesin domain-containing protein [Patescibacteria group bacterium]